MNESMPGPGDFVVRYLRGFGGRGATRIVVVHLTPDAGPEELFSSTTLRAAERAEDLAALWALQDGSRAWRIVHTSGLDVSAQQIGTCAGTPSDSALRTRR